MASERTQLMQTQRNGTASAIMRSLLTHGPQGRKRLAQTTGASFTTVTKIVGELVSSGALHEVRNAPRSRGAGRPELPLDLPGPARVVIGTHIHPDRNSCGAYDLRGVQLARRSRRHRSSRFAGVVSEAISLTQQVLGDIEQTYQPRPVVVGLGVATGGIWPDSPPGHPSVGPNQWRMAELAELFRDRLSLPLRVDTNVRALAVEQHWWGAPQSAPYRGDVLTIFVGRAIGVAVMEGDSLRRGRRSMGGAVSHLTVPGSTVRCECGERGCLDATCSNQALLERAIQAGLVPAGSPQSAIYPGAPTDSPELAAMRRERARALGRVLPSLIRLIEPDLTVLRGGITASPEIEECLDITRARYRALTETDAAIVFQGSDPSDWSRASATLALDEYLVAPMDVEDIQTRARNA